MWHKRVILLAKAKGRREAIAGVRKFLQGCEEKFWDRYEIGGLFSGDLNLHSRKFYQEMENRYPLPPKNGRKPLRSFSWIREHAQELSKVWKRLGETSPDPYSRFLLGSEARDGQKAVYRDDVIPLGRCRRIVQRQLQDPGREGKRLMREARRCLRERNPERRWRAYGFYLELAAKIFQQRLSSETSVFNTESCDFNFPEDIRNWYAAAVDLSLLSFCWTDL